MITSSGKQSDKELETSFVHPMQMPDVHVCHRDIAEFKISLPTILAITTDYTRIILPDDYVPNKKP